MPAIQLTQLELQAVGTNGAHGELLTITSKSYVLYLSFEHNKIILIHNGPDFYQHNSGPSK